MRKARKGIGNEDQKKIVIATIKKWIDHQLKDYAEPQRTGTAKGDAIGFPKKKHVAAALLAVHPAVSIKEIANAAEVKPAVLSVWRTQDNFKKKEKSYAKAFGEFLAATVVGINIENFIKNRKTDKEKTESPDGQKRWKDQAAKMTGLPVERITDPSLVSYTLLGDVPVVLQSEKEEFEKLFMYDNPSEITKKIQRMKPFIIDDSPDRWTAPYSKLTVGLIEEIIPVAAWLNTEAMDAFLEFIKNYLNQGIPGLAFALLFLRKAVFFWAPYDHAKVKEWNTQPFMLDLTKESILSGIDMLADPQFREEMGDEEVQKFADSLKKEVVEAIDDLT